MSRNAKRVFLRKKQYSIWLGGKQHRARFHSAEAGRAWQRQMRVEHEKKMAGIVTAFTPAPIEQAVAEFLEQRIHLKSIQHDRYRMNAYILTAFPGREVHAISTEEWMNVLGDGRSKRPGSLVTTHKLSFRTSNLIRSLIYSFYEYAKTHMRVCRENPIERIKALPVAEKAIPFLNTKEQIEQYLTAAKQDPYYPSQYYIFAMLSLNTGQRLSQVTGLKWTDIDFDNGVIWFKYKFDYIKREYVEGSKKGDGQHHSVGMNESLRAALLEWKAQSSFKTPSDYVLSIARDFPLTLKMTYDCNKRTLEALKLPYMKVHALRHTFATMFIEAGGNIYDLKEVLDHSTITVTERYKRLNRARQRKVAAVFEVTSDTPDNLVPLRKARS